ncbi:endonuclease III [Desulfonatronum thioautotrophicum]|uniref:endonuclease III n=1 Tax=Desulfonatronum thioautotrophicum TaxID=617001 RepID=UPI0005EBDCBA|nr:endonuclease III [Desulfonatronum thioautotrophicum]
MRKNIKLRATQISTLLRSRYPLPVTMLDWKNPWELLVATVLAAQCTDARVNLVTPEFFRRWPGPVELSTARLSDVEEVVHSTGFFRQKAKNLIASAKRIIAVYDGQVPDTMNDLLTLPGVARKTANIVLSNALGRHEGVAVDTHVRRLAFRLGLTTSTNPTIIERDLMQLFPRDQWGDINHLLVLHGRDTCPARNPRCPSCILTDLCPKHGLS